MKLFIIKEQLLVEAQLQNLIGKYKDVFTEDQIKRIVECDPTARGSSAGKYSEWLIQMILQQVIKNKSLPSQLSFLDAAKQPVEAAVRLYVSDETVPEYLEIFDKYNKYLKYQNIFQYKSIDTFTDEISDFKDSTTFINLMYKEEQKALYKEAKKDIETIYDGSSWKIQIPHSYAASRALGGDTKWCTAASDYGEEYFNKYRDETGDPDYYIIINKNQPSKKYQLHFGSKQLMDRNDDPVELNTLFEIAPEIIQPIYNREVKKGTIHQQAENQTISLNYTQVEDEISDHLVTISDRYEMYLFNNIKDELVTRIRKNPSLKDILQQLESADDKDSFLAQVVFNKYKRLKKLAEPVVVAIKAVMYKEIKENSDGDFSLEYSIKNKYIDDDAIDATITLHLDNQMPADILLAAFLHKKTKSTIYQYLVKALSYRKVIAESAALNVKAQEEFLNSAYDIVLNSTE